MMRNRKRTAAGILIFILFCPALGVQAGSQKYIFYLHGAWLETHGLGEAHPKHGRYQYQEVVDALKARGFQVESEIREGEVHPVEYATKVASRVRALVESGVPAADIEVIGHSKGGHMAMVAASLLQDPGVNYVVMAGCGKRGAAFRRSYERFLSSRAQHMRGRILSIYDSADQEAGTCGEAFSQAREIESQEVVLQTGRGHGLFYSPQSIWLEKVVEWVWQD